MTFFKQVGKKNFFQKKQGLNQERLHISSKNQLLRRHNHNCKSQVHQLLRQSYAVLQLWRHNCTVHQKWLPKSKSHQLWRHKSVMNQLWRHKCSNVVKRRDILILRNNSRMKRNIKMSLMLLVILLLIICLQICYSLN